MRLNVRFRNLVCPIGPLTSADQKKYDYYFDDEQTWIDTSGVLEFVAEDDLNDECSSTYRLENNESPGVSLDDLTQPEAGEEQAASLILDSVIETPTTRAPASDENPPDYSTASVQTPYDPPVDDFAGKLSTDNSMLHLGGALSTQHSAWPLENLHEGRLLQHFVTHIAPWVCKVVPVL